MPPVLTVVLEKLADLPGLGVCTLLGFFALALSPFFLSLWLPDSNDMISGLLNEYTDFHTVVYRLTLSISVVEKC